MSKANHKSKHITSNKQRKTSKGHLKYIYSIAFQTPNHWSKECPHITETTPKFKSIMLKINKDPKIYVERTHSQHRIPAARALTLLQSENVCRFVRF